MATQYAPRLALIAVVTVLGRGLLGDSDFVGTVETAAVAAAAFFPVGLLLGEIAQRLVEEHVRGTAGSQPSGPASSRPA